MKTRSEAKGKKEAEEKSKTKLKPEIKIEIKLESKAEPKATAQSELKSYQDAKDYGENEGKVINEKEEGLVTIEAATTPDEVQQALEDSKIAIDAIEKDVKHDSEVEIELPEMAEAQ